MLRRAWTRSLDFVSRAELWGNGDHTRALGQAREGLVQHTTGVGRFVIGEGSLLTRPLALFGSVYYCTAILTAVSQANSHSVTWRVPRGPNRHLRKREPLPKRVS